MGQADQLFDGLPGDGTGPPHAHHTLQAGRGKAQEHKRLTDLTGWSKKG